MWILEKQNDPHKMELYASEMTGPGCFAARLLDLGPIVYSFAALLLIGGLYAGLTCMYVHVYIYICIQRCMYACLFSGVERHTRSSRGLWGGRTPPDPDDGRRAAGYPLVRARRGGLRT